MHNVNWDDLRYVLAVAETGSLLQAARLMRINHATVLRHVTSFEARNGGAVFERTAQGYRVLPDRAHVIRAAQDARAAIQEVERLAQGGRHVAADAVRIASTDTLCGLVLPDFVRAVTPQDGTFAVTLLSSNMHLDLMREQAHLVVRPSAHRPDDLVGEAVAELGFAAYAGDPATSRWLGLTGPLARSMPSRWMAGSVASERIVAASDSFLTLREMAASGMGMVPLPCFVGDGDPRLSRVDAAMPHLRVPLWVARHADMAETVHSRAVGRRLADYLAGRAAHLLG